MESKLEATERKRTEIIQKSKEKVEEHLLRLEKAHQDLEVHNEATRVAAECSLAAKMAKVICQNEDDGETNFLVVRRHMFPVLLTSAHNCCV